MMDLTKLNAFADDKLKVARILMSLYDRKHCGKRRNAGSQHFLLFPQCFLVNALIEGCLKIKTDE